VAIAGEMPGAVQALTITGNDGARLTVLSFSPRPARGERSPAPLRRRGEGEPQRIQSPKEVTALFAFTQRHATLPPCLAFSTWFRLNQAGTPNIQPSTCASMRSEGERLGFRNAERVPSSSARESHAAMLKASCWSPVRPSLAKPRDHNAG